MLSDCCGPGPLLGRVFPRVAVDWTTTEPNAMERKLGIAQQYGSGSNGEESHVEHTHASILGALVIKSLMA